MSFLTNNVTASHIVSEGEQTRNQSLLISMGLIYLAIPNILFLWGWFTPEIAVAISLLICCAVGRAVILSLQASSDGRSPTCRRTLLGMAGALAALLIVLYYLLRLGMLGFLPSFIDHDVLRTAMFCNLRDAAWPVVLPNGKEMSYYLAGILPSALLARLAPASGQWAIVLWTSLGMMLTLLMASSQPSRRPWGVRLLLATLFLAIVCNPIVSYNLGPRVITMLQEHFGLELTFLCPEHRLSCSNVLNSGGVLYNSTPYALLVAAMLLVCRRRAEIVLPVALALLVPASPFAGIALLPLVAFRWWESVRAEGGPFRARLLWDAFLPAAMAFITVVYFTRADGASAATLAGVAWGWTEALHYELWLLLGWLLILLPLVPLLRRDPLFIALTACCALLPFLFIGSCPDPGAGRHNELWLKAGPVYLMLASCLWLRYWRSIGWYKYLFTAFCTLVALAQVAVYAWLLAQGTNGYLETDDKWNGHLNHDASFLNQSVPPCKEPLVPGIMLRTAGESEEHFPGCLLPKAPGCDYSRPMREEDPSVIAPL